jgi:hypothetical protein
MEAMVDTKGNGELTRLIGRRLREACDLDLDELPAAISGGLAALREVEVRRAEIADGSRTDMVPDAGEMAQDH